VTSFLQPVVSSVSAVNLSGLTVWPRKLFLVFRPSSAGIPIPFPRPDLRAFSFMVSCCFAFFSIFSVMHWRERVPPFFSAFSLFFPEGGPTFLWSPESFCPCVPEGLFPYCDFPLDRSLKSSFPFDGLFLGSDLVLIGQILDTSTSHAPLLSKGSGLQLWIALCPFSSPFSRREPVVDFLSDSH